MLKSQEWEQIRAGLANRKVNNGNIDYMTTTDFDKKEAEIKVKFDTEQEAAQQLEEQIKLLQVKHQERIVNMTRLQGAASLLGEMRASAVAGTNIASVPTAVID